MRFPDAAIALGQLRDMITNAEAEKYTGVVYQTQAYLEAHSLLTAGERDVVVELFEHLSGQLEEEFARLAALAGPEVADEGAVGDEGEG